MKNRIKLFSLLLAAMSILLSGCIKDRYYDNASLLQSKIELKVGETYQLTFGYDAGYPQQNGFFGHEYVSDRELQQQGNIYDVSRVLWKCSDTTVATTAIITKNFFIIVCLCFVLIKFKLQNYKFFL